MTKESEQLKILESKVNLHQEGYERRASTLLQQISGDRYQELVKAKTALDCFRMMEKNEQTIIKNRIDSLKGEVLHQQMRESELQRQYAFLQGKV